MHRVASSVTVGSVGDLGRIARALANEGFNIDAIGGGEGVARGGSVGIVTMLVTPDDDPAEIARILEGVELDGNRRLAGVRMYPAFDLELADQRGQLADAAELLGNANISIMGVLTVDVHRDWGIVSLAFEKPGDANQARQVLIQGGFTVLPRHGGRGRRKKVDQVIGDGVPFGDPVDGEDHDDPEA
jgi:hypothetical protein